MMDIQIKNINKAFGEKQVLEDFSCIIPAGKITCIEAPSGKGKTTLLNIIAGLISPDSGELAGVPDKIAFVFQEDRLCEDFSAVSNIKLTCGNKLSKEEICAHLKELGLEADSKPVKSYSGGMKRRVAIARAICYDADLVILDEPFKGLDENLKRNVMDYVIKYTEGKTVICVSHDRSEAEYLGGILLTI
ncbi:MAG: ATP-binding cassette domain-containing protein [Clostridia bacterium]|nr:ATP-binding cassette domain-containing protein [Clostridia bacterium]